jgi:tRNA uridine 5-carboxymethylaminomethyl modification enzyme
MRGRLENQENLFIIQSEVIGLKKLDDGWEVATKLGEKYRFKAVILATGTYLGGRIIVGESGFYSGPDGQLAAMELSDSLRNLGLDMMRFKTGTPPRVHRRSIDFDKLEEQHGDDEITPFSFENEGAVMENKIKCHLTYTNERTHDIIRENLHRSPMYSGEIKGTGARYCPSIEDKIVRFTDKERHQLFLEPMGLSNEEIYIQGFSTSMPTDVQVEMVKSLSGLENAEIMRYAYAIEYDVVNPLELNPSLEYKKCPGFFGAGQINGTSGYEEAAVQGLIAGINAVKLLKDEKPIVLGRDEAYIGVLIDDLVTKGVVEPYRMMTARAEFRLQLRQENADMRLTPIGYELGLISQERYEKFLDKKEKIDKEIELLRKKKLDAEDACYEARVAWQYEGYIARQEAQIRQAKKMENRKIPEDIDYTAIKGLRIEARQRLELVRPQTVGQASRVSGVNPADIAVLMVALK